MQSPPASAAAEFQSLRHFVLSDEYLTINARVARSQQTLVMNEAKDPISRNPVASVDELSLVWLPHIETITPGAGDVEPALLQVPVTVRPGLAARVDITQGLLQTNGTGPEHAVVDFVSNSRPTVSRAVAREIVLTLDVLDDFFILESRPLDGSTADATRSIRFDNVKGETAIRISIGNEPAEDIYAPEPQIVVDAELEAKETALEFSQFYKLSRNTPADPGLPQIKGRRPSGNLCATGYFNPTDGGIV
jgi:hypothetical protein